MQKAAGEWATNITDSVQIKAVYEATRSLYSDGAT